MKFWPPVTVASRKTELKAGSGVQGHLGILRRSKGMLQVTFRGLPLYRYDGDHANGEANRQGIASFGDTWHVLRTATPTTPTTTTTRRVQAIACTAAFHFGYIEHQLRHNRRNAILACGAVAAFLPGDAITLLLETVPLYLLFEASLLLASIAERRAARA